VAEDTPENLTQRLKGAGTLKLEVRGEGEAVARALNAVPGVLALRSRPLAGEVVELELDVEQGRDLRAELARAVVQGGFDLLELQRMGMSLEEIFLHLTTTDATVSEGVAVAESAPAGEPS
jgi:ABC-2 type transport system ATP-binding protein